LPKKSIRNCFDAVSFCSRSAAQDVNLKEIYVMQTLFDGVVRATDQRKPRPIEFSPLDHFVMGHHTHGPIFGFETCIDPNRFKNSLATALSYNPEMGVSIAITDGGRHVMQTESGVQLTLQKVDGPMPPCQRIGTLPLEEYPLAHGPITAHDLIDQQLPLLGFRITQFADGRSTLGVRTTHSHIDGTSLIQFLSNLGEIYNGGQPRHAINGRNNIAGLGHGSGAKPSEALHLLPTSEYITEPEETHDTARFAHTQIIFEQELFDGYAAQIKEEKTGLTTSDIICALAWKAWALSASVNAHSTLRLYSIFNLRQVKALGLPPNYQGNAVIDRRAELGRALLQSRSVADIADFYRRQVKPMKVHEIAQDIAYLARLHRQGAYSKDGAYNGFLRSYVRDMATKQGLNVNDLRFLPLHKIKFDSEALWYESGQDFPGIQGYLEVSQRYNGNVVFHYHSLAEEAEHFEWELRKLVSAVYLYC
jgi:hypothetical protein